MKIRRFVKANTVAASELGERVSGNNNHKVKGKGTSASQILGWCYALPAEAHLDQRAALYNECVGILTAAVDTCLTTLQYVRLLPATIQFGQDYTMSSWTSP